MSETNQSNDHKIVFKKKNRIGQRRRQLSDESEEIHSEDSNEWNKLNELKQIQNQRKRSNKGINILELTQNSNNNINNNNNSKNETKPFGGVSDAKTLSNELDLGNTFSVETNRRDEDTDLMKYIEEELSKRKGTQMSTNKTIGERFESQEKKSDMNSLFDVLPDHLIGKTSKKSEEMLSNQMLNGIPEVELGLDEKIRNIEATEEAKVRLIENRNNRSNQSTSSFVPNNIAVCFVQHNRYNIGEDVQRLNNNNNKRLRIESQQQNTYVEEPVVVIGDEPKQMLKLQNKSSEQNQKGFYGKDKASDDYIFEKFKKQFRKF